MVAYIEHGHLLCMVPYALKKLLCCEVLYLEKWVIRYACDNEKNLDYFEIRFLFI